MSRGRVVHLHAAGRLYVSEYPLTVPASAVPTIVHALGGQDGDDVLATANGRGSSTWG